MLLCKNCQDFFFLTYGPSFSRLPTCCCVISLTCAGRLRNAHSSPRACSWKPPNRDRYLFCCRGLLLRRTNLVICGCFQRVSFLDGHIHLSPIVFAECWKRVYSRSKHSNSGCQCRVLGTSLQTLGMCTGQPTETHVTHTGLNSSPNNTVLCHV